MVNHTPGATIGFGGMGFVNGTSKMYIVASTLIGSSLNTFTNGIFIDNNKIGINKVSPTQALDVVGQILCGSLKGGQGNSAGNFHIDQHSNNGNMYLNYYSTGFVIVGSSYYTLFDTGNGTHKQVVKFASGTSSRVLWDFLKK